VLGAGIASVEYIRRLSEELLRVDTERLERLADLVYEAWENGAFVFVCGNGGSATTASHMSEDLGKGLYPNDALRQDDVKRLKVLSLTDNVGWITAVGNDLAYDQIFVQQLMNYASPGDVLIAISGSGNSPNVLRAVEWANHHELTTFGLIGFDGGRLKHNAQQCLHVDFHDMGMVESIHLGIFHWVLDDVFARVNRCGRYSLESGDRAVGVSK
jgi:D-sedoheptulose 7-phosphate isomerase